MIPIPDELTGWESNKCMAFPNEVRLIIVTAPHCKVRPGKVHSLMQISHRGGIVESGTGAEVSNGQYKRFV